MFKFGQKLLYLAILACFQLVGIALFCKGFFPYKIYLPGYASRDDIPASFQPIEPEFDRLVFVVIDALRNDFILGKDSGFDFINSQIQQGAAYPFTAKATAPTVTMPRIKALTTGTIPSFLDAILNIAESDTSSSLDFHDNWVHQFKHNGNNKKIHFFGDDTWIRLFPGLFDKMDGTTSFFVSDTVQVDVNVTRHIKTDLIENDWDAVILHYLGLDHIGHLGGPHSPLMKPKQKEMDKAIESIYEIVAKQDAERMVQDSHAKGTLIVVCGDHGMNEKGNHGGSSIGETSAALVFLSPRFESRPSIKQQQKHVVYHQDTILGYPVIDQIDLVPTLATLFSFPIPKNNLGKVIYNVYGSENVVSLLSGLQANAYQLGQLLSKLLPEVSKYLEDPLSASDINSPGKYYAEAFQLHKTYSTKATDELANESTKAYIKFIQIAQSYLSNTASDYNLHLMISGVLLISTSTIVFVVWAIQLTTTKKSIWDFSRYFSMAAMVGYSASMFASSFVEEEHMTWYYLLQTMIVLFILHSLRLPNQSFREKCYPISLCVGQLMLTRIAIAWHLEGTGPAKWHLMALTLFGALVTGIHTIWYKLDQKHVIDVNQTAKIILTIVKSALVLIMMLNSMLVLVYKMKAEGSSLPVIYQGLLDWELVQPLNQVQLGRLIFNYGGAGLFVLAGLFYVIKRASLMIMEETHLPENKTSSFLQILLHLVTPLLVLLSNSDNAFIFLIFNVQYKLIQLWLSYLSTKSPVPIWLLTILVTCLGHAAFFLTGHTNSIASIDLSNAYVGVQEYDTMLIGLLTFCSNWSASLWWSIAGWSLVEACGDAWFSFLIIQSAIFGLVLSFLSVSVTVLREHLFIWTVFSPKYLYQVAWTVLFHYLSQVVIGSLLTQLIFKWNVTQSTLEITEEEKDDGDDDAEICCDK